MSCSYDENGICVGCGAKDSEDGLCGHDNGCWCDRCKDEFGGSVGDKLRHLEGTRVYLCVYYGADLVASANGCIHEDAFGSFWFVEIRNDVGGDSFFNRRAKVIVRESSIRDIIFSSTSDAQVVAILGD